MTPTHYFDDSWVEARLASLDARFSIAPVTRVAGKIHAQRKPDNPASPFGSRKRQRTSRLHLPCPKLKGGIHSLHKHGIDPYDRQRWKCNACKRTGITEDLGTPKGTE